MPGRQSRRAGSGRDVITVGGYAFLEAREWSGGPPRGHSEWSGGPPGGLVVVSRKFQRARSGRENLPEGWEDLPECRENLTECWEGLTEGQEWFGCPHGAESGRKDHPEYRERSDGPPRGHGMFGRPSWRAGSGREAIPEGREWSGGNPRGPGVVERQSQRAGRGQ